MPTQKIVTFKGEDVFECLYTGLKIKECYAIPNKAGERKNGGSFADSACAWAWLLQEFNEHKMTKKKLQTYQTLVENDLGLDVNQNLEPAPRFDIGDLEEGYEELPLLSYRKEFPFMYRPDLALNVDEVLKEKERNKKEKEEKEKPSKSRIYQITNNDMYELEKTQFPLHYNCTIHFGKTLDCIVLQDLGTSRSHSGHANPIIKEITGLELNEDALVIISKKLKIVRNNERKKASKRKLEESGGDWSDESPRGRCCS